MKLIWVADLLDLPTRPKYKALVSKARDKEKYSTAELNIWCSVRKMKGDGVIPSKAKEIRAYTTMLKD